MIRRLLLDNTAAAAAEMALIVPLLIMLILGSFELGNYFWNNHIVIKAVRDGARYASRQTFDNFDCDRATVSDGVKLTTRNIVRTNQVASGGSARLPRWTDPEMVDIEMRPEPLAEYRGFYVGMECVPVVIVTATVPYRPLLGMLGFDTLDVNLKAISEVPVMGL